jgi:hypothetical protein
VLLGLGPATAHAQPTIVIDYSLDTNNFFGSAGSPQRTTLETAASILTSRLSDTLTAINPITNVDDWTADFLHPGTGASTSLPNLTIPQNTILVYAGGRNLSGPLGQGGPGGFSVSATNQSFFEAVVGRGQPGALGAANTQTDFGRWGGSITFDTVGPNWHFSLDGPSAGEDDFLSVALHELGHLLGFGLAPSWQNLVSGSSFTGPVSTSLFGSNPPVTGGHWGFGTMYQGQEVAMDPDLLVGTRKNFTELDFGGLDDLGWQVTPVPEPATVLGVAALGLAGALGLRRRSVSRSAA